MDLWAFLVKPDILGFNAKIIFKLYPKQEEPQLPVTMDQKVVVNFRFLMKLLQIAL